MRILIDIGHPAHVHYFRNFIEIMQKREHIILVVARDKEVSHRLLQEYNIPYINRGKGGKSFFSKLLYLIKTNLLLLKKSFSFKPDIFLSFSSPYASQVAWLQRRPHIAFTDTEHAKLENRASLPFSAVVITPDSFQNELGEKHIKFDGFMELIYLHKNYFSPNSVSELLKIDENEKYIVLRFVSWDASHDAGHSGLDYQSKVEIVERLSKDYRLFISSESELPDKFIKYKIDIPPQKMHDVLANAHLFIGEGATMASECAMLGTPVIYVNTLNAGTLMAQERSGSIFGFRDSNGVLDKAMELLETPNLVEIFQNNRESLLENSIDVTAFMVWFVENYPDSFDKISANPNYQKRFR